MAKNLTPRERKFVEYYLQTGKARASAVNAGYSPRGASTTANRLLKNNRVLALMNQVAKSTLSPELGVTKAGVVGMCAKIVCDTNVDVNARLKGLALLSRLLGFYTQPTELLLALPEDQIFELINQAKSAITIRHEEVNGFKTEET